jgi:SAM domain (Sterile alpha motif)
MEGGQLDPAGDDDFDVNDQYDMDEEADYMQDTDQQDANEQPYDNTFMSADNPYLDADSSLEPTSEAANNVSDEFFEEGLDGNDGQGEYLTEPENASNMGDEFFEERPDENDGQGEFLTEPEVGGWDHKQTADYLRQIGVDPKHCEALEEQGVTGNALLGMGQESILSQHLNFGPRGKRLKTSRKIQQFQQDLQDGGALRDPPAPVIENAGERTEMAGSDPLKSRSFKHPFTWKHDMAQRLQIDETSDTQPEELLEDLLDSSGQAHLRDNDGDVLSTRQQADFRFKLNRDEVGGVERATSSMCADLFDMFNAHRRLKKYRPR